jgi:hypothetical protein
VSRYYLHDRALSAKAQALADFDMDSIRQIVAAKHSSPPTVWLVDPDQYEQNGRLLRDSTSPRLLAYSPEDRVLYATDGCNSCEHQFSSDLGTLNPDAIRALADGTNIRPELLEYLQRIL